MNAAGAQPRQLTRAVGLAVFLGTTAMLFATLLFAYAVVRAQAIAWPPPGTPPFPALAAGLNGLLLVAVSVALRRGRARTALGLGAGFLVGQVVLWRHLVGARLGPGAGALGDVFFALSALHALHVAGGLAALALRGRRPLGLVTTYWDFVLVVWAIIYVAVCAL